MLLFPCHQTPLTLSGTVRSSSLSFCVKCCSGLSSVGRAALSYNRGIFSVHEEFLLGEMDWLSCLLQWAIIILVRLRPPHTAATSPPTSDTRKNFLGIAPYQRKRATVRPQHNEFIQASSHENGALRGTQRRMVYNRRWLTQRSYREDLRNTCATNSQRKERKTTL